MSADSRDDQQLSKKFCAYPWRHAELLITGAVIPCCSLWVTEPYGNTGSQNLEQMWNSDQAKRMRASILDGTYSYCRKDLCRPILTGELPNRDDITDPELRAIIDNKQLTADLPREIVMANDETCNLTCPSCRSGLLVASDEKKAHLEKVARDVVFPALDGQKPMRIWISGQGDPWSSPHYRSVLRYLCDHQCQVEELRIYTNGVLMTEATWSHYRGLERYRPQVIISIDAASREVYARLRRGDWDKLQTNLRFLSGLRKAGALSLLALNMTVQSENYFEMPGMVRLAQELGCDEALFYLIQPTGGHLAATYHDKNVAAPLHPEYPALLETLRDPIFDAPLVRLYDISTQRNEARAQPSAIERLEAELGRTLSGDEVVAAAERAIAERDASRALELIAALMRQLGPMALLHNLAGMALFVARAPERAELHFERALGCDPSDLGARLNLGIIKADRKQWAVALPLLTSLPLDALDEATRAQVTARIAAGKRTLPLAPVGNDNGGGCGSKGSCDAA